VEICTVGSVRGESVGAAMFDLHGHEAGNGGYSQGRPTARRILLYSERCPIFRVVHLGLHTPAICLDTTVFEHTLAFTVVPTRGPILRWND
jgi:hypothetical protein